MKRHLLFLIAMVLGISYGLKAQPTLTMTGVTDINYDRATFTAQCTDKDDWIINGYGFIYDTISPPARATGARIKQISGSTPPLNVDFSATPTTMAELLASGKTYYVRAYVKRMNPVHDTAYSDIMTFVTPDATPPIIVTKVATDTGLFSAIIHGEITQKNDPNILVKGFVYDTLPDPVHGGSSRVLTVPGGIPEYPYEMSRPLTGLISNKIYYYRAFTICKFTNKQFNDTIYANEMSFKTLHPCDSPPYDVDVDEITRTTAQVSWTRREGQVNFDVDYGFVGHEPGEGVIANTNYDSITITNLTAGMSYSVFVRSVCSDVNSDWSVVKTFFTIPPLCAPIDNIYVIAVEHSSAVISWTPGSMLQNTWEIAIAKFTDDMPETGTIIRGNPTFYPIGLQSATRYKIRARAICENGYESDWSDDFLFTTLPSGLDEISSESIELEIYPNPSDGLIQFKTEDKNIDRIEIWDSLGEIIYQSNKIPETYAFEEGRKGVFLIRVYKGDSTKTKKVIIH